MSERFRTIVPSLPHDPRAAHTRWEREVMAVYNRRPAEDDDPIAW